MAGLSIFAYTSDSQALKRNFNQMEGKIARYFEGDSYSTDIEVCFDESNRDFPDGMRRQARLSIGQSWGRFTNLNFHGFDTCEGSAGEDDQRIRVTLCQRGWADCKDLNSSDFGVTLEPLGLGGTHKINIVADSASQTCDKDGDCVGDCIKEQGDEEGNCEQVIWTPAAGHEMGHALGFAHSNEVTEPGDEFVLIERPDTKSFMHSPFKSDVMSKMDVIAAQHVYGRKYPGSIVSHNGLCVGIDEDFATDDERLELRRCNGGLNVSWHMDQYGRLQLAKSLGTHRFFSAPPEGCDDCSSNLEARSPEWSPTTGATGVRRPKRVQEWFMNGVQIMHTPQECWKVHDRNIVKSDGSLAMEGEDVEIEPCNFWDEGNITTRWSISPVQVTQERWYFKLSIPRDRDAGSSAGFAPRMCLTAPEPGSDSSKPRMQPCEDDDRQLFYYSRKYSGERIHVKSHPGKCLRGPEYGADEDDRELRVKDCKSDSSDSAYRQRFYLHGALDDSAGNCFSGRDGADLELWNKGDRVRRRSCPQPTCDPDDFSCDDEFVHLRWDYYPRPLFPPPLPKDCDPGCIAACNAELERCKADNDDDTLPRECVAEAEKCKAECGDECGAPVFQGTCPGGQPEWSAAETYLAGDEVLSFGMIYTAQHWTSGDEPGSNSGPAGSGAAWSQGVPCDLPACIPDCQDRTCGDDGCGNSCGVCIDGETCHGAGVCQSPSDCAAVPWQSQGVYTAGDVVSHGNREYTAWYWTQGQEPTSHSGPQSSGLPWGLGADCAACVPNCSGRVCGDDGCGHACGLCDPGQTCDANGVCQTSDVCTAPAWSPTTVYTAGDVISFAGSEYQAWYWTQNQAPATNSGPQTTGLPWSPGVACNP